MYSKIVIHIHFERAAAWFHLVSIVTDKVRLNSWVARVLLRLRSENGKGRQRNLWKHTLFKKVVILRVRGREL